MKGKLEKYKEKLLKINKKFKNIKHRRKIIWILFFLLLYSFLILQVKRIETISTFPAVYLNVQDIVGHVQSDINFEEINIKDSK